MTTRPPFPPRLWVCLFAFAFCFLLLLCSGRLGPLEQDACSTSSSSSSDVVLVTHIRFSASVCASSAIADTVSLQSSTIFSLSRSTSPLSAAPPAALVLATFVVISCERPSIAIEARESLHAEERPGSGPGSGSGSGRAARRGEEGRRDWIPDDRQGVVRRRCEPTDAAVGGACARNKRTEEEHAGGAEDRPCRGRGRRRGADEELPQPQVSQSNCKLSHSLSVGNLCWKSWEAGPFRCLPSVPRGLVYDPLVPQDSSFIDARVSNLDAIANPPFPMPKTNIKYTFV